MDITLPIRGTITTVDGKVRYRGPLWFVLMRDEQLTHIESCIALGCSSSKELAEVFGTRSQDIGLFLWHNRRSISDRSTGKNASTDTHVTYAEEKPPTQSQRQKSDEDTADNGNMPAASKGPGYCTFLLKPSGGLDECCGAKTPNRNIRRCVEHKNR